MKFLRDKIGSLFYFFIISWNIINIVNIINIIKHICD